MSGKVKLWIGRGLIGAVLAMNVQSALAFLFDPGRFTSAYELSGAVGAATIQGFGVLFLMWNVPYFVVLWHPRRFRGVLIICIIMQTVGLIGESYILWGLSPEHTILHSSIIRFIIFDGGGLIALILASWVTRMPGSTN